MRYTRSVDTHRIPIPGRKEAHRGSVGMRSIGWSRCQNMRTSNVPVSCTAKVCEYGIHPCRFDIDVDGIGPNTTHFDIPVGMCGAFRRATVRDTAWRDDELAHAPRGLSSRTLFHCGAHAQPYPVHRVLPPPPHWKCSLDLSHHRSPCCPFNIRARSGECKRVGDIKFVLVPR